MANPYFNATYYLANNPDVFAAGINTAEGAWAHYEQYGAAEALNGVASRSPAPWFDIVYYRAENPDLNTAGLTAGQLFTHFTEYGLAEGRSPSAAAEAVDAASLAAYAAANADLREAFGIEEGEEPTEAQLILLAKHFYQFGYNEDRPGAPASFDENPGQLYTLTTDPDVITGTTGDDVFRAVVDNSLQSADILDGGAGNDVLNIAADGIDTTAAADAAPVIRNIETINNASTATLNLAEVTGVKVINSSADAVYTNARAATTFAAVGAAATVDIDFADAEDNTVNLSVDTDAAVVFTFGSAATSVTSISLEVASDVDVDLDAASALESLTVSGAADTEVINTSDALELFDASAATGDITYESGAIDSANTEEVVALGGSGADTLDFSAVTDADVSVTIDGGAGNDTLIGGDGDDVIAGGAGADTMTGGGGDDLFVIEAGATVGTFDIIMDFGAGNDTLTFGGPAGTADNFAVYDGGAQPSFNDAREAAQSLFADGATYAVVEYGSDSFVFFDADGNGIADMAVCLDGVTGLTATDFDLIV